MKQSDVLIRPYVTEKSMNHMSGTPTQKYKDGNKIEFIVHRNADKHTIKIVFEERFEVKVERRTESTPSSNWLTATPQRMSDPGSEYSEGE